MSETGDEPTVVVMTWGNVIEDWLGVLGLTVDDLLERMTGGWLFGYLESLATAGMRPVIICVSAAVSRPEKRRHRPTGATVWLLPPPWTFRIVDRLLANPHAWSMRGALPTDGRLRRALGALIWPIASYLTTPVLSLARVLRYEACDVLLCQEYEEGRFDLAVLIGKLLRLRVFATYQGGNLCRTRFERLIRSRSVRAADGLLIGASVERQRVQASYAVAPERVHPIANPVAIRPTGEASRRARARQDLNVDIEEVVVTWVGRIDLWAKGLDVLVDAWERCCLARPDLPLRLLILGSGPDAAEMGRRITAATVTNIHWHNEFVLDWTVIWRYYDAADIYAFPSRHEGFAVAPLEAMASGLPVVAASAQGVADLFGDDDVGLLVPVDDPVAFADALGRLIDDPATRRAMGQRALDNVARRFSVEVIGEQLSSAFLVSRVGHERMPETAR